jgi:hypothetical protein
MQLSIICNYVLSFLQLVTILKNFPIIFVIMVQLQNYTSIHFDQITGFFIQEHALIFI